MFRMVTLGVAVGGLLGGGMTLIGSNLRTHKIHDSRRALTYSERPVTAEQIASRLDGLGLEAVSRKHQRLDGINSIDLTAVTDDLPQYLEILTLIRRTRTNMSITITRRTNSAPLLVAAEVNGRLKAWVAPELLIGHGHRRS
jgi:hypothetical protein